MDADVEEPWVFSELTFVLSDDGIRRIGDRFIVQTPHCECVPGGRTSGKCDIVALPRIRLAELDLPLRIIAKGRISEISGTGINLPVGERARRARKRIDEVAAL